MENKQPRRPLPSGPFPIFAGKVHQQSKRPRVALYTHPNNIMPGANRTEDTSQQQYSSITPSWKRHDKENYSTKRNLFQRTNQESTRGRPTASSPQYYTPHYQTRREDPPPLPPPLVPPPPTHSINNTPVKSEMSFQKQLPITSRNMMPTQHVTQQSNSVNVTSKHASQKVRSNSTRVVTTTGHGLQQWVSYTGSQHVIYEIFGVVTSPVLPGDFGSKKFLLKTLQGTVKCHFWEMGSQLLNCTRGKHHRVMGSWDRKNQILKCVSVRLSTQEEIQFLPQILETSERLLKHFTTSTREQ